MRSSLALGLVLGGIATILGVWAMRGGAESKELTGFLVGAMGSIMGFYFGRQGVDAVQASE